MRWLSGWIGWLVFVATICCLSAAPQKITIGYVPNLAFAQLFVIAGEGWDKEAGLEIAPLRFPDAAVSIQAFEKGEIDVLYTIITSALIGRSKGQDIVVVAGATQNSDELWGLGRFAELAIKSPAAAFGKFRAEQGRPVKILNFYRGSISDTSLRYWLAHHPEIKSDDYVITNVAGQFQFTQALLTADYDATCLYEPLMSIARDKGIKLEQIMLSKDMLKHPDAVLVVRGEWARKNPELVHKLITLNSRATELLKSDIDKCVPDLQKFVSAGMLTNDLIRKAAIYNAETFASDPHPIESGVETIQRFFLEQKVIDHEVDLKTFINTSFYDEVVAKSVK